MTPPNLAPPDIMLQMISGFWVSRIVYAAAKLGIADLLQERPQTVAELATYNQYSSPIPLETGEIDCRF